MNGTLEIVQSPAAVFSAAELDELISSARNALPSRIAAALSSRRQPDVPSGYSRAGGSVTDAPTGVHVVHSRSNVDSGKGSCVVRIGEDGEPLQGGPPDTNLIEYAEAILTVQLSRPEGLLDLPAWIDRLLEDDGRPTPELVAMIPALHTFAAGFADESPGSTGFLRRHLLTHARKSSLPLDRLLEPRHWRQLAPAELTAFVLTLPERLDPRERALQTAAVDALASDADWQLRDAEQPWQRPDDPAWWERLRSLAGRAPKLVPTPLLADLGRGLRLDALPSAGAAAILTAEMHQGSLWRRSFQAEGLARAAFVPGVFPVLLEATERGLVGTEWTDRLHLIDGSPSDWSRLAEALLASLPEPTRWGCLLRTLLPRLSKIASRLSVGVLDAALAALARLRAELDTELWLGLLDLVTRIDSLRCRERLEPRLGTVLAQISSLTAPEARAQVLDAIASGRAGCLRLADLADPQGQPRLAWLLRDDLADVLLRDAGLRSKLAPEPLLRLIAGCTEPDLAEQGYRAIDNWLAREPNRTAGALIAADAWGRWRRKASPRRGTERNLALLWLTHAAHAQRREPPTFPCAPHESSSVANALGAIPSFETWRLVVKDLGAGLDSAGVRRLTEPGRGWPWLPGLEQRQIEDLSAACVDTIALADLTEALARLGLPLGDGWAELIVTASKHPDRISASGLRWLVGAEAADTLPTLDLDESTFLCARAGERYDQAVVARIAAIAARIETDPTEAITAAAGPNLWGDARLQAVFRERLPRILTKRKRSFPYWVRELEQRLRHVSVEHHAGPPSAGPATADSQRIAAALHQLGFTAVAELLCPDIEARVRVQPSALVSARFFVEPKAGLPVLIGQAKAALLAGDPTPPLWSELAILSRVFDETDTETGEQGHPLLLLAGSLSGDLPLEAVCRQRALACIESILQGYPGLFAPCYIGGRQRLPFLGVLTPLFADLTALIRWLLSAPVTAQWRGVPGWRHALIETLRQARDDDGAENRALEAAITWIEHYHGGAAHLTHSSDSTSKANDDRQPR